MFGAPLFMQKHVTVYNTLPLCNPLLLSLKQVKEREMLAKLCSHTTNEMFIFLLPYTQHHYVSHLTSFPCNVFIVEVAEKAKEVCKVVSYLFSLLLLVDVFFCINRIRTTSNSWRQSSVSFKASKEKRKRTDRSTLQVAQWRLRLEDYRIYHFLNFSYNIIFTLLPLCSLTLSLFGF